jgi:hypothetical protein
MPRVRLKSMIISFLAVAAAGCTSGPPPTEELARAHNLVAQADQSQARSYAPQDLDRAHDELSQADAANARHEYDVARSSAESAAADADVAVARASAGEKKRAADQLVRGNEELRRAGAGSAPPDPLEGQAPPQTGPGQTGAPPPPPADTEQPPR